MSISLSALLMNREGKETNICFPSILADLYDREFLLIDLLFYNFLYFPEEEAESPNFKLSHVSKVTQPGNIWLRI